MGNRIGVDVGGTFTDLIFIDETGGEIRVAKELSTHEWPEVGVLRVIDVAVTAEELRECRYFMHGTTLGINALLERRGATVGLLATEGFRDVLEKRRSDYREIWNPCWRPDPPLVPRRLRLPVRGRIGANASVVSPLAEKDVEAAVDRFAAEGVECIAIAFINAYASPEHELLAEEIVRRRGFEGHVTLSHRVSGEYREFERTATTVIDAYLRPRMVGYLDRLENELRERGCEAELLLTRSGGGALTFAEARMRPFETILSGPVGGAVGAGQLACELEIDSVITADVGGTSFDTCLVTDGRPSLLFRGEVLDLPLQIPWVDVRSIGAGGGSISWVEGGLLRVGPQSAGSDPGPASYRRGGSKPTITDAAVALGLFGHARLAGGLQLDHGAAVDALASLSDELGLSMEAVARGGLLIASTMMAGAIKAITVERGVDPRKSTLMMFGGAGGLFATLLATELGVKKTVVPRHPGTFSAWGLLQADVVRSHARTRLLRLDDERLEEASSIVGDLFEEFESRSSTTGADRTIREVALDLRYAGQEHTLTVPAAWTEAGIAAGASELAESFTESYERTFGHTMEEPVELVTMRATVRDVLPSPPSASRPAEGGVMTAEEVEAYSFAGERWTRFAVVERDAIRPGGTLSGPAIVVEPTSTTYVDRGFVASCDPSGALLIERIGE